MENFIIFPIEYDRKKKAIINLDKRWKQITKSIDIAQSTHYGCITGKLSNITVLEFSKQSAVDLFPESLLESRRFDLTPSRHVRYYFQYEENLNSIYSIVRGLNVINNNCFIPMGDSYTTMNKQTIQPMDKNMVEILLKLQTQHDAIPIAQSFYDLVSQLPDKWFNQRDYFAKIINAIRNTLMADDTRVATIKAILVDRFNYYDEHLIQPEFDRAMNHKERRFGVPALSKLIKAESPDIYQIWHTKWKTSKMVMPPEIKHKFKYKFGAATALSDIKAIQPGLSTKKLLAMNSQFTASKINICKHCRNKHLVGCCKKYGTSERTMCTIIANIKII